MTPEDIATKLEGDAARLIENARGFKSRCNEKHKSGFIGKASGYTIAAQLIREHLITTQEDVHGND
jgi:hypothetical protein